MTELLKEAFNPETFRKQGHQLVNLLADYLDETITNKSSLPVLPYSSPDDMYEYWKNEFEDSSEDFKKFYTKVLNKSIHIHNPKYMGHQVSPALPMAALSDFFSSFLNNSLAVYEMGSTGIAIERIVIKILKVKQNQTFNR